MAHIKIACDATPLQGAGICVIYQTGETTRYILHGPIRHNYGMDSSRFEMKNVINVLKKFKRYIDQGDHVKIYSDNDAILSDEYLDTQTLERQVEQLENHRGCVIELYHDTIGNGNRLVDAADELSRGRIQKCREILAVMGAQPMGVA